MAKVSIDGKEYDAESLPKEAKNALASIQFLDAESRRLQGTLAAFQTARIAYSNVLKQALDQISTEKAQ